MAVLTVQDGHPLDTVYVMVEVDTVTVLRR